MIPGIMALGEFTHPFTIPKTASFVMSGVSNTILCAKRAFQTIHLEQHKIKSAKEITKHTQTRAHLFIRHSMHSA